MKLYLVSSALALITNAASISGQQFPNEGRQYADYERQMGEQYTHYGRAMGEQYAPKYDDGYNYPEYDDDDGYNYNNMGGYEGGYRNYMGAKSSKGPPGRAYGAKSFKGSSSDGGRAYYGAKAFKEDGPYYAGAGSYLSSDAAPIQLAALHSESQRDARYEPASGSDAYCCSVVAGQEECSQDMQYNSMKTTFPLNGVDAILCCDGGITTIHDWCAGSVGPSLEKDTKEDDEGPTIIHSEARSESITKQSTESHSGSASGSTKSSSSTTTATITSTSTCSEESGVCVCSGSCPDFTIGWMSRGGSTVNGKSTCVASKSGASDTSINGKEIVVNGKSYNGKLEVCSAGGIGTYHYISVLAGIVGAVSVAL